MWQWQCLPPIPAISSGKCLRSATIINDVLRALVTHSVSRLQVLRNWLGHGKGSRRLPRRTMVIPWLQASQNAVHCGGAGLGGVDILNVICQILEGFNVAFARGHVSDPVHMCHPKILTANAASIDMTVGRCVFVGTLSRNFADHFLILLAF